jgi:hypothetical protein
MTRKGEKKKKEKRKEKREKRKEKREKRKEKREKRKEKREEGGGRKKKRGMKWYLALDDVVQLVDKRLREAKKGTEKLASIWILQKVGMGQAAQEYLLHCGRTKNQ